MYPNEVLTKSKKGKIEVRKFLKRGIFVKYQYIDPATGKIVENGKTRLILKSNSEEEHYFIIPLKQKDKFLLIIPKDKEVKGKLWNGKKAIDLW